MPGVAVEIAVIALLVLLNGALAMSELAVVSARKSRLQDLRDRGSRGAAVALILAENPNRFLATVQIGITMVGIISGAYGGVTIGEKLGAALARYPWLGPHAETVGVATVVVAITLASLIIGELVPKRIGLRYADSIAANVAIPMSVLATIGAPAVWLLSVCTDGVLRLLGLASGAPAGVSDEEIRLLVREGTEAGVFEETEQEIIEGALGLDRRRVAGLMTPRQKMVWLDISAPEEESIRAVLSTAFSRYPVCDGSPDKVLGFVNAREMLSLLADQQPVVLRDLVRKAAFIPETATALEALEAFQESGAKVAFVVDEYGVVGGMLTLADVLEVLVGDDVGGEGGNTPKIVQRDADSFFVDGLMPVAEFEAHFGVPVGDHGHRQYHTIAGLAMQQLGAIPSAGDTFEWEGLSFEVVDMDGHRVDKVIVTRPPQDQMD
ncbi:MAG: HlyC/CorC family transporter [Armatimonadetes bacterium]|nr:HlyC/CorC family transporter [Armatimonadota bacterium]